MTSSALPDERVLDVLRETLAYSRERDYTGWDYCDGLSSRFLQWLPFENKWINLAVQESAKRAPVNVRPLLLVEQRRNYMGAGLFAMANLNARRVLPDGQGDRRTTSGVDYADEAARLLDWTIRNRCRGYSGFCGSHQHEIQVLSYKGDPSTPSIVSTAFPAMALLRAGEVDTIYPTVGRTAADFVVEDLDYREVSNGAVIKYLPTDSDDGPLTPNAMAIGAHLLVDLYAFGGEDALADRAAKILDFVADLQTDRGGWTYSHPPEGSHLSMDNFHNGFILEAFLRYAEVVDSERFDDVVDDALSFYRGTLFESNGAPNWDERSAYPRDVHAAAQGILVFTRSGEYDRAARVLRWTLDDLYAGDGRFYYRKQRFYTRRMTLMRWGQAWMAYAISEYLNREGREAGASRRAALPDDR